MTIHVPHQIAEATDAAYALRAAQEAEAHGDLVRAVRLLNEAVQLIAFEIAADAASAPVPLSPWVRRAQRNELPIGGAEPVR